MVTKNPTQQRVERKGHAKATKAKGAKSYSDILFLQTLLILFPLLH